MQSLTLKQRKWADKYFETGNGTQSALSVYKSSYSSARSISSENLTKPNIREYLKERYKAVGAKALMNIINLAENSENESIRLKANSQILDRVYGKNVALAGSERLTDKTQRTINIITTSECGRCEMEK